MKADEARKARTRAAGFLKRAGIAVTPAERAGMEIADFGLGDLEHYGIEVVVYESNDRYCAKELVLFPRQICPEHRHPPVGPSNPGKQETFRCRWGEVYLYVAGEAAARPKGRVPTSDKKLFTVWREIVLRPGDQFTLPPDSPHWFQAGDKGAVVSEFSSPNLDEMDVWTDRRIKRIPVYEE